MGRLPAISIEGLHMSRHYFNTFHKGSPISVILGWDRPMNYFFLVIEEQNNSADNSMTLDLLYSNLKESDPFNHDLDYYRAVLRHFQFDEIGRAPCGERVCQYGSISVVAVALKKK